MVPLLLALACAPEAPVTAELVLTDADSYDIALDLDLTQVDVAEYTDVVLDWSGLSADMRGQPLSPTDITEVDLVSTTLGTEELAERLVTHTVLSSHVRDVTYAQFEPGRTQIRLSELSMFGTDFDPQDAFYAQKDGTGVWFAALGTAPTDETTLVTDVRTLLTLLPTADGTTSTVELPGQPATLQATVDLVPGERLPVSSQATSWTFDCSQLTELSYPSGGEVDEPGAGSVFVAHTPLSVDAVEDDFLTVLDEVDATYGLDGEHSTCTSTPVDLGELVETTTQAPFDGFTADGTWFVGWVSDYSYAPQALPGFGAVVELVD